MQKYTKILLATMSFDIGGVETHVLELAVGLKEAGYTPIVASNGGVFEAELKEKNIKHYKVPLHNKNPLNMWRSYWLLRKIIKKEKIDIVHAHARIPAFILGILEKSMKFPFVTSVHALFNTAWLYKMNSNWGKASIAVSEDLKQYLVDCYHIPKDNIIVTINGISTDKFDAAIDTTGIVEEFKIDTSKKIIGHISRLDEDRSLVAKQLVEIAEDLYTAYPNSLLVIVGAGNEYEMIKKKADEVNAKLGFSYIIMTGARTDINKFTALSDVFVGVSRAALEAMSAECPCVIAGNEGYIGIFTPEKLALAQKSNFTCREEKASNTKDLKEDVLTLLNLDEEASQKLATYGREVIKEHYSIDRMTQDNIELYERGLK
ncbi:MAG: glycosyltransferase [Cellulosilyticaceae bacterium]